MSRPVLYSGGLRPFTGLDHPRLHGRALDVARRALADCVAVTGAAPAVVAGADFEDCWEDMCRMSAAWRATDGHLTIRTAGSWTPEMLGRRLGPVTRAEEGGFHARDRFADHPLLHRYGGRVLSRCTIGAQERGDVDYPRVDTFLADLARAGHSHAVVKSIDRKGGIWKLPTSTDVGANHRALLSALGWTSVRLDGAPGAVVVQPLIDMRYEYRLFIVDGEIVSGAGCVEEFTPLDARAGCAFDHRVRARRGHLGGTPSEVEEAPGIVTRYLAFAEPIAAELAGTVVIDVALDAGSGTPAIVELNDLPNSGLYASDPWLVAERLMAATDRGYGPPQESSAWPPRMWPV